jgi:hypothetical protein
MLIASDIKIILLNSPMCSHLHVKLKNKQTNKQTKVDLVKVQVTRGWGAEGVERVVSGPSSNHVIG